jgi:hypothetical protein
MPYIHAFFKALLLTLQGKIIEAPPTRYPKLQDWVKKGAELTAAAYRVSEQNGMDEQARKNLILHLDGRDWSMELILSSVRYHMQMEYPSLLQTIIEHNITTLYALNLDDQYRMTQLAELGSLEADVQEAIQILAEHLQNIPPSDEV